jgi:XTP/dITP diphosphohydrolase
VRLLIATTNPGKLREFRDLLDGMAWHCVDLSALGAMAAIEETGQTFRANAVLKAAGYAKALGTWTLADDSGLCVDALEGKPGVHSARWAAMNGAGRGDAANNKLLLEQMENVPDERRGARFVCALALADPRGDVVITVQDDVHGRLLRAPAGVNGFGYDPLFFVPDLGKTTAQLPPEEKHRISHRGKALRRMRSLMEEMGIKGGDEQDYD